MIEIKKADAFGHCNSCNKGAELMLSIGLHDEGGHRMGIVLCNDCLRKLGKQIRELPNE